MSNFNLGVQNNSDTIIALATPAGKGAIAVLRLSGESAISITQSVFKGKNLEKQASHTIHFGTLRQANGEIVDEVLVSIFRAPTSYTSENVVEISCHGSPYIVQAIIRLFAEKGVRYAQAGEFTKRAFLNGKLDLAQAEAVADLIASQTQAAHRAAMSQMKGGFSKEIAKLREKLLNFAALIELELDFGEEDVEFADRNELKKLILAIIEQIEPLLMSFKMGNVIKNGIPVVIAGKPNAGKSTLLNVLLHEEKAIVSEIAGTTRDFIEDEMVIHGVSFRFIDTAGLRNSVDIIENLGIERAKEKINIASLVLYLIDLSKVKSLADFQNEQNEAQILIENADVPLLFVGNKCEEINENLKAEIAAYLPNLLFISALNKLGIEQLIQKMLSDTQADSFIAGDTTVTNARHFENLNATQTAMKSVLNALENQISSDLLAYHIREALQYLGEITGEVTNDEILGTIFSKFCIGK